MKAKKILALILCLVMCMSLVPAAAFADGGGVPLKYVALGDSTGNGYLINDYARETDYRGGSKWIEKDTKYSKCIKSSCRTISHPGCSFGLFDNISAHAYPSLLKDDLETKKGYSVNFVNLVTEGMRIDELRCVLDEAFYATAMQKGKAGDTYLKTHVDEFGWWFDQNLATVISDGYAPEMVSDDSFAGVLGLNVMNKVFTDAIRDADVITLDAGTNNFGTYLSYRLQAIMSNDPEAAAAYSETIDDLANEAGIDISALSAAVKKVFAGVIPEGLPVDALLDTLVYCYCDFCVNFTKTVELIRSINTKNAKLIVVGTMNPMEGLVATMDGIQIDAGALWGTYMGLVNSFITTLCPYNSNYFFADCSKGINTFVQAFIDAESYEDMDKDFVSTLVGGIDERFVDYQVKAFQYALTKPIDLSSFLANGLNTGAVSGTVRKYVASCVANDGDGDETILDPFAGIMNIYARLMTPGGMGSHPDEKGHEQKFKAVKAAYESNVTASGKVIDTAMQTGGSFFSAILKLFDNPILNSIGDMMNKISRSLDDFFALLIKPIEDMIYFFKSC